MEFEDYNGEKYELPDEREPTWRPSVYALIIEKGEVLLVKPHWHDMWELPGGGVEIDENFDSALERETLEETGYQISKIDEEPLYLEENFFYAPTIDEFFHTIPIVFRAELNNQTQSEEEVDFEDEIEEVKWFSLEDTENIDLHPMTNSAMNDLSESE